MTFANPFFTAGEHFTRLINGHNLSNASNDGWYSDLNLTEHSLTRGQRVRAKVNIAAMRRLLKSELLTKLSNGVSILCNTAHPGAHEFGDQRHQRSNHYKGHGSNWYLDHPAVVQSISRQPSSNNPRSLGAALDGLNQALDENYPVDPRSILDAMTSISKEIEVKFLFTIRSLPSLLNSHPAFDGGLCRHGLVLAATLCYFGTISRSLPRSSWRVVWYECMQNVRARKLFEKELSQWLGWKAHNESEYSAGRWRSSSKPTRNMGVLSWAKMVEEALVVNGSFGLLLDRNQILGYDDSSNASVSGPLHRLRALMADADRAQQSKSFDETKLWATEWGCSEERDWYSEPLADPSKMSASGKSANDLFDENVENKWATRDAAQFLRCNSLLKKKTTSGGAGTKGSESSADLIRCVELLQKE